MSRAASCAQGYSGRVAEGWMLVYTLTSAGGWLLSMAGAALAERRRVALDSFTSSSRQHVSLNFLVLVSGFEIEGAEEKRTET
jgi:hypothetical protein